MKKLLKIEFLLQGTESNIDRIEKEIAEISIHEEVIAFNSNGKKQEDRT